MTFLESIKKMVMSPEEKKREAERLKREEERLEQEKKAAAELRKQQELERKRKKMEEILKPTCEKGDCLWNDGKFYFTCPKECECERKKYTKKDWGSECAVPEFWPYMKRLEKLEKEQFMDNQEEKELYKDFMHEFFPQYPVENWALARLFIRGGLGKENQMLAIFPTIHNAPKQKDIIEKLEWLYSHCMLKEYIYNDPFCQNISLYERSLEDFEYTVNLFATVLNCEELEKYFIDISNISVEQLYDADGNIKQAGCGGPAQGFYGDTLYNTVESWSGENGENDIRN